MVTHGTHLYSTISKIALQLSYNRHIQKEICQIVYFHVTLFQYLYYMSHWKWPQNWTKNFYLGWLWAYTHHSIIIIHVYEYSLLKILDKNSTSVKKNIQKNNLNRKIDRRCKNLQKICIAWDNPKNRQKKKIFNPG